MADITRINCRVGIEAVYNSVACLIENDFRVDYSVGFVWFVRIGLDSSAHVGSFWFGFGIVRNIRVQIQYITMYSC